jgi:hypothetical protein
LHDNLRHEFIFCFLRHNIRQLVVPKGYHSFFRL